LVSIDFLGFEARKSWQTILLKIGRAFALVLSAALFSAFVGGQDTPEQTCAPSGRRRSQAELR
jgi:hypothetical protein